ncbi:uncharacterized protein [Panulirus ornatus]|uniref:uncharacterized protein n=1 Tax=Panulirus ornatus TaxID=150431 RepID=UPI003A85FBE3
MEFRRITGFLLGCLVFTHVVTAVWAKEIVSVDADGFLYLQNVDDSAQGYTPSADDEALDYLSPLVRDISKCIEDGRGCTPVRIARHETLVSAISETTVSAISENPTSDTETPTQNKPEHSAVEHDSGVVEALRRQNQQLRQLLDDDEKRREAERQDIILLSQEVQRLRGYLSEMEEEKIETQQVLPYQVVDYDDKSKAPPKVEGTATPHKVEQVVKPTRRVLQPPSKVMSIFVPRQPYGKDFKPIRRVLQPPSQAMSIFVPIQRSQSPHKVQQTDTPSKVEQIVKPTRRVLQPPSKVMSIFVPHQPYGKDFKPIRRVLQPPSQVMSIFVPIQRLQSPPKVEPIVKPTRRVLQPPSKVMSIFVPHQPYGKDFKPIRRVLQPPSQVMSIFVPIQRSQSPPKVEQIVKPTRRVLQPPSKVMSIFVPRQPYGKDFKPIRRVLQPPSQVMSIFVPIQRSQSPPKVEQIVKPTRRVLQPPSKVMSIFVPRQPYGKDFKPIRRVLQPPSQVMSIFVPIQRSQAPTKVQQTATPPKVEQILEPPQQVLQPASKVRKIFVPIRRSQPDCIIVNARGDSMNVTENEVMKLVKNGWEVFRERPKKTTALMGVMACPQYYSKRFWIGERTCDIVVPKGVKHVPHVLRSQTIPAEELKTLLLEGSLNLVEKSHGKGIKVMCGKKTAFVA